MSPRRVAVLLRPRPEGTAGTPPRCPVSLPFAKSDHIGHCTQPIRSDQTVERSQSAEKALRVACQAQRSPSMTVRSATSAVANGVRHR